MNEKATIKHSVIVPVYNAESTVRLCLDRFCCQLRDDVEILLINDGSKDASGEICREYAARYENFRYFEKENGGVSSARNLGLDNARGEYLLFTDSDDFVSEDYFETVDAALCDNVDMLMFGACNVGGASWSYGSETILDPAAAKLKMVELIEQGKVNNLVTRAIKRALVSENKIRFSEDISIAEDTLFIFQTVMHVKSFKSVDKVLYNCSLDNSDSLSRKPRPHLAESLMLGNKRMFEALNKSNDKVFEPVRKELVFTFYRSVYSCAKDLFRFDYTGRRRRKRLREICRMYSAEKIKPIGAKAWLIALPVKLRLAFIIDLLGRRAAKAK